MNTANDDTINRRDFFTLSTYTAAISALFVSILGLLKFPMPGLFPEVSSAFKIGKPEDFPVGSTKVYQDKNVLVSRDAEGLYAVSLVCTHLGCIVSTTEKGFKCPCHGSVFDGVGSVIAGPAPKGLNWLDISRLPTGKLIVDTSKTVDTGTKMTV